MNIASVMFLIFQTHLRNGVDKCLQLTFNYVHFEYSQFYLVSIPVLFVFRFFVTMIVVNVHIIFIGCRQFRNKVYRIMFV